MSTHSNFNNQSTPDPQNGQSALLPPQISQPQRAQQPSQNLHATQHPQQQPPNRQSHSSLADHNPSNHSQRGNNRDRRQIAGMRALADHISRLQIHLRRQHDAFQQQQQELQQLHEELQQRQQELQQQRQELQQQQQELQQQRQELQQLRPRQHQSRLFQDTPNSRLYWVLEGLEEYITAYEQDPNFDIRDRLQKLHPGLKTEILYYRTADIANQYRGLMQRYDNIARIYNPQHRPTQLPMAPKVR